MNIEAEKIELLKLILETEDEAVIQEIKSVFKKQELDFWNQLPDSVKVSINRGIEDVEAGRTQKHDQVMQELKDRYGFNS
ncbi:hypothetical protein [Mucilaginibacter arboris]|uniref:Addiction module protein n=1 Tax=Mucilaginibacter arboris TaxID=2682090 RepID=A0A7K1SRL8_9SPHI|nr:hypothetical protein [Mucilaginibacter arboris]MVN19941.1 hypothetical protein [Mucilaginibacter arboris]